MIKVDLCKPDLTIKEIDIIKKIFLDGSISHGKYISLLEKKFSSMLGVKYSIAVNSCTSGLYCLALYYKKLLNSGEVLVPSFTWNASVNSIKNAGLTPVFLDINKKTLDVDLSEIKKKTTPKTIGLMIVHYAGRINQQIKEISYFAKKKKLFLIEDCAETLNTEIDKKKSGSYGHGVFSFYGTKNITCGEGGIITTSSEEINQWIRTFIAHGVVKNSFGKNPYPWNRNSVIPGQNLRLSNLQAGIAYVQAKRLGSMQKKRITIAKQYYSSLSKLKNFIFIPKKLKKKQNSFQMFPIIIKDQKLRNSFVRYLNLNNIGASVHFDPPVHKQTAYNLAGIKLDQTEKLSSEIVTLPMSSVQTKLQTEYVIKKIENFFKL
jgi:dTDP-4-amino-4,6-dideoxygalactose transaminase